jgi:hypothetical protein
MKAAAFQELLESVRHAGAYLKGNRKAVARTVRISLRKTASPQTSSRKSNFR